MISSTPFSSTAHAAFDAMLAAVVENQASDLHLSINQLPSWRRHGEVATMSEKTWLHESMKELLTTLLAPGQQKDFDDKGTVDLGYTSSDDERFRINVFRTLGRAALVARHLPSRFGSFNELRLPESLRDLAHLTSGMVLITGVTGSGKSTTLATMINEINENSAVHILTIEDPVEFVHRSKRAIVSHRELHTDVPDFASAVRASLREDPDVILVGELRDNETMRAALTAAETGHLVLSTMHTADATGAIERFVGAFPGQEQSVVRHRLSLVLKAVVAQQLLRALGGARRIAAVEVLQVTAAVSNLIASGRTAQIYSAIESGREAGMQTFDQALAGLVRDHLIELEEGRRLARDPLNIDRLLRSGRTL